MLGVCCSTPLGGLPSASSTATRECGADLVMRKRETLSMGYGLAGEKMRARSRAQRVDRLPGICDVQNDCAHESLPRTPSSAGEPRDRAITELVLKEACNSAATVHPTASAEPFANGSVDGHSRVHARRTRGTIDYGQ